MTAVGEFSGKVVLITGAGRGLGRRAALAFARAGASLALDDLTPIHLDETAAQVERLGAPVKAYTEDAAMRMPVQLLAHQAFEDWGRVDALVLAASVRPANRIAAMDEWDWHRTLAVNLTAPFLMLQAFAPVLESQGGASIVTVGPVRHAGEETGRLPAYAASKTGLLALTRAAAAELAPRGIRLNAVFSEPSLALPSTGEATPPRPLEDLLLWLAGPRSASVSGQEFLFED
jgi:NAD(P)-dependent dehydrogenase (short-subunit alcohol dehydrogenase family)